MSSPLARSDKNLLRRALIKTHQHASHDRRVELLAALLAKTFGEAGIAGGEALDIGCGDMRLSEAISGHLPSLSWRCIDIHPAPTGAAVDRKWSRYSQFDGRSIEFPDRSFRVAVLCDVLHHASPADQQAVLSEASRVADLVVVKDHFEYGRVSRRALQGMDFLGNWAYGVSVPKRYFDQGSWSSMVMAAGLTEQARVGRVALYGDHPVLSRVLRDEWQFVSVLG